MHLLHAADHLDELVAPWDWSSAGLDKGNLGLVSLSRSRHVDLGVGWGEYQVEDS